MKKKWWQREDPDAAREAQKYSDPIPSRRFLLRFMDRYGRPIGLDTLTERLELTEAQGEALRVRLAAMVRDGQLIRNRRGGYCLTREIRVVSGKVVGHRDGYGFLTLDEGGRDVFLSPRQMRELMHGDRAAVRLSGFDARGRPEGILVEVLERRTDQLVGRYVREAGLGFVIPDNRRISHKIAIPPDRAGGAQAGKIVIVQITRPPGRDTQPIGRVTRVLGEETQPGIEIEMAIHSYGLPHTWSKAVRTEARTLGKEVPAAARLGRKDLRDLPLLTIDGADAKDFDDAVYCEPTGSGWRLIVAIADVAHYVRPDSKLDEEAKERGTSVYFTHRVLPMLPEVLSNGLCSLKPRVDRLCMVCDMRINRAGTVTRSHFYEAVMCSAARLTYSQVAAALVERDPKARRRLSSVLSQLETLHEAYRELAKERRQRGAIEFEMPQALVVLGENRRVERIESYHRNDAHRIIEECMIAANVQAAKFLKRHRMPTLYRVHDLPDPDRVEALHEFLTSLNLRLPRRKKPRPADYTTLMHRVSGRPEAGMIETIMLRSMAKAVYQPRNIGHFGLSLSEYAHFTSPIRRYPDLLVHRGIKHVLHGGGARKFPYQAKQMEMLGTHCSDTERRADDATRDALEWLKCDFMRRHLGDEFDAIISGVTSFGLFVQLTQTQIDGLVHVATLRNDYYEHDPVRHELTGRRTGRVYRLAEPLRVRVTHVDMNEREVDFEPVLGPETKRKRRSRV